MHLLFEIKSSSLLISTLILLRLQNVHSFLPQTCFVTNRIDDLNKRSNVLFRRHTTLSAATTTTTGMNTSTTSAATPTTTSTNLPDFRSVTTVPPTHPLSPLTFAGKVESALLQKYNPDEIQRVLESWRLLDQGYEHREYFGPLPPAADHSNTNDDENNNNNNNDKAPHLTPSTSNCYQYAHSYVPGLTVKPFWSIDDISWAKKLIQKYPQIRKEFQQVTQDMDKLIQEGNNIWAGALTQEAGQYGDGWKTLVLKDRGIWDPVNCNLFPKTAKAVEQSGIPATEVFFASMKPHSDIKLHSDFTNFVLTSHLALDIPDNGKNKCRLTVGDETREWRNGEVMLFDTSLMHDAVNESDGMRYILMFRVWHPDLTEVEREALQYIYDCLSVPEMLDENEEVRANAEGRMEKIRQFPRIKSASVGFGNSRSGSSSNSSSSTSSSSSNSSKKKKRGK
jgi:aspartate beta-hydroxylase